MEISKIRTSKIYERTFEDSLSLLGLKNNFTLVARLALSIGIVAIYEGKKLKRFSQDALGKEFNGYSFFAKGAEYSNFIQLAFKDIKQKGDYEDSLENFLRDCINFGLAVLHVFTKSSATRQEYINQINQIKYDKDFLNAIFAKITDTEKESVNIESNDIKEKDDEIILKKKENLSDEESEYIKTMRIKINDFLSAHNFKIVQNEYILSPSVLRIKIKIDIYESPKNAVKTAEKLLEDLKLQLELSDNINLINLGGYICFDLPRKTRGILYLKDLVKSVDYKSNVEFPIGKTVEGKILSVNLSNSNTPHLLIAGATGQGKSECLKAIISTLILRNTTENLKLILIDPKMGEFIRFKNSPFLMHNVIFDAEIATTELEKLCEEMDQRYQIISDAGFNNIEKFNKTTEEKIPRIVVFFDEFADFMVSSGKDIKKRLEDCLKRLTAKARAAGIHLILSTQRPDRNVMEGVIKSNIPARISLKTSSPQDSQIIIGSPDAHRLYGRGDMIVAMEGRFERLQGAYISDEEMNDLLFDNKN